MSGQQASLLEGFTKARDWQADLQPGEELLWSGRPRIGSDLVLCLGLLFFVLVGAHLVALFLIIPLANILLYGRDAYALTDRRILLAHQPLHGTVQVESLPRDSSYPAPAWWRGTRSITFTAPDQRRLHYRLLNRADHGLLIALASMAQRGKPPGNERAKT